MAEVERYPARQRYLQWVLELAAVVTGVAATIALVLPEDAGQVAGGVALGIVVTTPVVRTLWLAIRWARKGDWRFCGAAVAVVAVIATGAFLAA